MRFLLGCNTGGQENLQRNDRESISTRFWQTLAFCKMTTPPEHRSCRTSPGNILPKINMEPKNGLGRCFSFSKRVFSGEPLVFGGEVYTLRTNDGFFTWKLGCCSFWRVFSFGISAFKIGIINPATASPARKSHGFGAVKGLGGNLQCQDFGGCYGSRSRPGNHMSCVAILQDGESPNIWINGNEVKAKEYTYWFQINV